MISDTIKIDHGQGTDEILLDKLPKENFPKSYTWIPSSFKILLIMFGIFGHLKDGSQSCLS